MPHEIPDRELLAFGSHLPGDSHGRDDGWGVCTFRLSHKTGVGGTTADRSAHRQGVGLPERDLQSSNGLVSFHALPGVTFLD
jgi:hypothetical protein